MGHRREASPAQAGDGTAAVQPVRTSACPARVRAALRGHRARAHDVEPPRLGTAVREVPRRHPGWQPSDAARLRMAEAVPDGSGAEPEGAFTPSGRRGARLYLVATVDRVVREEPARLDGHH